MSGDCPEGDASMIDETRHSLVKTFNDLAEEIKPLSPAVASILWGTCAAMLAHREEEAADLIESLSRDILAECAKRN